jgi:hypothetical protein
MLSGMTDSAPTHIDAEHMAFRLLMDAVQPPHDAIVTADEEQCLRKTVLIPFRAGR